MGPVPCMRHWPAGGNHGSCLCRRRHRRLSCRGSHSGTPGRPASALQPDHSPCPEYKPDPCPGGCSHPGTAGPAPAVQPNHSPCPEYRPDPGPGCQHAGGRLTPENNRNNLNPNCPCCHRFTRGPIKHRHLHSPGAAAHTGSCGNFHTGDQGHTNRRFRSRRRPGPGYSHTGCHRHPNSGRPG